VNTPHYKRIEFLNAHKFLLRCKYGFFQVDYKLWIVTPDRSGIFSLRDHGGEDFFWHLACFGLKRLIIPNFYDVLRH